MFVTIIQCVCAIILTISFAVIAVATGLFALDFTALVISMCAIDAEEYGFKEPSFGKLIGFDESTTMYVKDRTYEDLEDEKNE